MRILSFGEILWDVYPEKSVIGGAPFNFSAHAVKLGADVDLLTSIGRDDLGVKTLECINDVGVNDKLICYSPYPTGACFVTVDKNGTPTYDLHYDMAYDHISLSESQKKWLDKQSYQALYFGTLSQRHLESRNTLNTVLSNIKVDNIVFDVNIRQMWYDREILEKGLKACTMLKVSREECEIFEKVNLVNCQSTRFSEQKHYYETLCRELSSVYNIQFILFTLDKDGAMVYDCKKDFFYYSEKPKGKVVSTVGAGDSFSACFLCSYLKGYPINECLHKAIILSDFVVRNIEAIPKYSDDIFNQIK